jgi:hypothetical protein
MPWASIATNTLANITIYGKAIRDPVSLIENLKPKENSSSSLAKTLPHPTSHPRLNTSLPSHFPSTTDELYQQPQPQSHSAAVTIN